MLKNSKKMWKNSENYSTVVGSFSYFKLYLILFFNWIKKLIPLYCPLLKNESNKHTLN